MIELIICIAGGSLTMAITIALIGRRTLFLTAPLTIMFWFSVFCFLVDPLYLFFGVALLLLCGGIAAVVGAGWWIHRLFTPKPKPTPVAPKPLSQLWIDWIEKE